MSFKEIVNGQMDRHMMTTDVTDHSLQVSGAKIINIVTYDCKLIVNLIINAHHHCSTQGASRVSGHFSHVVLNMSQCGSVIVWK